MMTMQHNARVFLVIVAASVAVSACGVKSVPQQRPDATYSKQYPEALPPLKVTPPAEEPTPAPTYRPDAAYPNTAPAPTLAPATGR